MSSWSRFTLVALVSFGLGLAAARWFPAADPTLTGDLAWEQEGDTVRLTAKTPGYGYLIFQADAERKHAAPQVSWIPHATVNQTLSLKPPVLIYRLDKWLVYPPNVHFNKCLPPVNVGCPPPPGGPFSELFALNSITFSMQDSFPTQ